MQHHTSFAISNVCRPNFRFIPRHVWLRPCLPIQLAAIPHRVEYECMWLCNDMFFASCAMHHNEFAQVLYTCHPLTIWRDGNAKARGTNGCLCVDATCTCCTTSSFPKPSCFCCIDNATCIGQPLETATPKTTCHTGCWFKLPELFSALWHAMCAQFTFSLLTCPKHQYIAPRAYLRLRKVSGIETTLKGNSRNLHGH